MGAHQPAPTRALHADGVISPFEAYEDPPEFNLDASRAKYGSLNRFDLILHSEADSTNNYRHSKQADVLMLPTCSRPRNLGSCSTTWDTRCPQRQLCGLHLPTNADPELAVSTIREE